MAGLKIAGIILATITTLIAAARAILTCIVNISVMKAKAVV